MNELDRLRQEVRATRGRVTAKIARIRRNTGVDVGGTIEDPRRPLAVVKKYNTAQLHSYLNKLEAFQSRSVGFVPGAQNVPIPKAKWAEYKRLETRYNATGRKADKLVENAFIPTAGMTIKQYQSTIHPTAMGDSANRPYSQVDRKSTQVKSVDALARLTRDMRRKLSPNFFPGEIKKSRREMNQMFDVIGASHLKAKAARLTEHQFNTVWNYTNIARAISHMYAIQQMINANAKERWHNSVLEDQENDIGELLDFGLSQPKTATEAQDRQTNTETKRPKNTRRKR